MESRVFKLCEMACPKSEKIRKFETLGELPVFLDSWSRNLSAEMEEKEAGDGNRPSSRRFSKV